MRQVYFYEYGKQITKKLSSFKLHDKIYKEVLAYAKECQSSSKRQLDNLVHKDDVEDFSNMAVENIEVLDKKVETLRIELVEKIGNLEQNLKDVFSILKTIRKEMKPST